jgi:hypothetical protein
MFKMMLCNIIIGDTYCGSVTGAIPIHNCNIQLNYTNWSEVKKMGFDFISHFKQFEVVCDILGIIYEALKGTYQ